MEGGRSLGRPQVVSQAQPKAAVGRGGGALRTERWHCGGWACRGYTVLGAPVLSRGRAGAATRGSVVPTARVARVPLRRRARRAVGRDVGNQVGVFGDEHVRIGRGAAVVVVVGGSRGSGGHLTGGLARGADEQDSHVAVVWRRSADTLGGAVPKGGGRTALHDSRTVGVISSVLDAAERFGGLGVPGLGWRGAACRQTP